MVKITNTEVFGWDGAFRGMRNPKNSWNRSDSQYCEGEFVIGPQDLTLAHALTKGGTEHRKFLRMVYVTTDFVMPLYLTPEFDTYKVGTTRNSCSFMHKGTAKPFEIQDFTFDEIEPTINGVEVVKARDEYVNTILNTLRDKYLETKDFKYFRALRQYLPMGFNIKFTWSANYEVLLNMYFQRRNHRLQEWHDICDWIENLPNMNLFIDATTNKKEER
jgi:hypothetical protein